MLLTLATYAFAAELRQDHPSTYTVKKGDTLWDISARFLQKPWLWPEIWQANPQVKNPHLIYPGDVLSLVYIDGRPRLQATDGPRIGESVETVPLKDIEPFLKDVTVVDDVKSLPYVVGIEDDRLLASSGQLVYVRGLSNPQPGQRMQIARPISVFGNGFRTKDVSNAGLSVLDFRGDRDHSHWSSIDTIHEAHGAVLGYEMMRQSTGEVIRVKGDITSVLLRDEGRDVRVGDRILPEDSSHYDAQFQPHPPGSVAAAAKILAIADGLNGAGPKSVVALATGARDGVDNGTVFSVWHPGALRPDTVAYRDPIIAKNHKDAMPDDYLGHVMVFRTFDKVSYAIVMDGIRPILVDDVLKDPDAEP